MRELTAAQFISWAEGYYGKYPAGQMADMVEYLAGFDGLYLAALRAVVTRTYESQYGKPPDVAIFDKAYRAACQEKDTQLQAIPRIESDQRNDEDAEGCIRIAADLKTLGITQADPHWVTKVWQLRIKRGDYKQGPGGRVTLQERNGIKVMDVQPFHTGAEFGRRPEKQVAEKVTAWDDLGGEK